MADNLNYKPLINDKMKEFTKEFPGYSFGEILYSIFRGLKEGVKNNVDLLSIDDKQFYTAIDLAVRIEKE